VRAVIAESFERIHRSNLVGMGVLPIVFLNGQNAESLGLRGDESLSIGGLDAGSLVPRQTLTVKVTRADGTTFSFEATCRLDTAVEINYYKNGGILQTVLRKMLA
jgi:aconitate hydratase